MTSTWPNNMRRSPTHLIETVEEAGEVAKDILDKKPDVLKTEVTQVAAMALAWLEVLTARRDANPS